MAILFEGDGKYRGLSTDTKPTAPSGFTFYETDTYDTHVSDGTYWWLTTAFNPYSIKRWGSFAWGVGAAGTGILASLTAGTGAGSQGFIIDNTNGRYFNLITGTTLGNKGGYRTDTFYGAIRQHNPRMRFRFQLTNTTLHNLYIGFTTSTTQPTGADPLNARVGFFVGMISGGTNFIVLRNDTTGATDVSGNVAGSAQAIDTAMHTVSIVADEPNTRWSVKWDNNAYVHFTTDIPGATDVMTWFFQNETNESAVAKAFKMYTMWCQIDK